MTGRGRGKFASIKTNNIDLKFRGDTLSQLEHLQGPRSSSVNFEDAPNVPIQSLDSSNNASKYENLILKILTLKADDDGILVNQKYKHILETWQSLCDSPESIQDALDVIHRRGLYDAEFAIKLVNMMSSLSYNSVEIHNVKIRNQFIAKLQQDFDNCQFLQSKNPIAFRNAVRMLGEFYHKARLTSGHQIRVFASPLKQYLEMLLTAAKEEDLELFTSQFYMNGLGLKATLAKTFNETLLQIRQVLAKNEQLTSISKFWLLLALDVANYNFGILPDELQKFYINNLGSKVVAQFERINTELSIQTIHKNEILDKIISNVNVMKVDNSAGANNWDGNMSKMGGGDSFVVSGTSGGGNAASNVDNNLLMKSENFTKTPYENHDGPKPSFGREKYLVKAQTYKKITPEPASTQLANWGDASNSKRENGPRPILGVGARLQQHKMKSSSDDGNWRERNNESTEVEWRDTTKSELNPTAAGWDGGKCKLIGTSGWNVDSNKDSGGSSTGSKKSWNQHDDRTETDYTNT